MDIWAYATTDGGGLERCTVLDVDRLKVKREIYYAHMNHDDCDGDISCDVIKEDAGSGQVEVVDYGFNWMKAGWPRHLFTRMYMGDILDPGAVYGMRYQACAVHSGD